MPWTRTKARVASLDGGHDATHGIGDLDDGRPHRVDEGTHVEQPGDSGAESFRSLRRAARGRRALTSNELRMIHG